MLCPLSRYASGKLASAALALQTRYDLDSKTVLGESKPYAMGVTALASPPVHTVKSTHPQHTTPKKQVLGSEVRPDAPPTSHAVPAADAPPQRGSAQQPPPPQESLWVKAWTYDETRKQSGGGVKGSRHSTMQRLRHMSPPASVPQPGPVLSLGPRLSPRGVSSIPIVPARVLPQPL